MVRKEYGPDYWSQPDDTQQSGQSGDQSDDDRYDDGDRYDDDRYGTDADRYGTDEDDDRRKMREMTSRPGSRTSARSSRRGRRSRRRSRASYVLVWIIVVIAIIVILLAVSAALVGIDSSVSSFFAGSSSSSSSSSLAGRSSDASADSFSAGSSGSDSRNSTGASAPTITFEAWERIATGADGSSKAETQKILGTKPSSSTSTTIKGVVIDRLRWSGVKGGTPYSWVSVEFQDDHAVLKSAYGLVAHRDSTITLAQYQKIAGGQSTHDVEALVGRPDSVTVSNYGSAHETWRYTTGVKGGTAASFRVVFTDGAVASTSQNDME